MSEASLRVSVDRIRDQIQLILRAWGMDEEKLRVTAEVMVETDLMGVDSHGISMLIMYEEMQRAGQLRLNADPRVVRETASTALVDGGAGLGHAVSVMATNLAASKALSHDVGVVSVVNSHHHGALGYYAELLAKRGLIGIVSSSSRLLTVVPTFGSERVLGTNPFAFAAPGGKNPPIVLDMSTSVVAANKVKVYALNGWSLPEGWVVDARGQAVIDSAWAYKLLFEGADGGLAPIGGPGKEMGGHKGYGLAVFAQILASTLGGASFSPVRNRTQKPSEPDNIGHLFMAINPETFRPIEDFRTDVDTIVETLRGSRRADEARPVLIPGDPERAAREDRNVNGIPIPESLQTKLRQIAAAAGAPYVLEG